MKNDHHCRFLVLTLTVALALTTLISSRTAAQQISPLPTLDLTFPPLAPQNQTQLFNRLVMAFDQTYLPFLNKTGHQSLADDAAFYYLRQELQALIDMWRATGKSVYLEQACLRTKQAIMNAHEHPRPLRWHKKERGNWPCFFYRQVVKETGGHSQLNDFQGATGLLMVASLLKSSNEPSWDIIADQVEQQIIVKWLTYKPSLETADFQGPQSAVNLLAALDSGRDKREHFASMCLYLDQLGSTRYPYAKWAHLLTDLYVGIRPNMQSLAPKAAALGKLAPPDWGLLPQANTGGYIWYYAAGKDQPLQMMDTSHGNRTVWLACETFSHNMVPPDNIEGLVHTLKRQIWAPQKGPFYFNNLVDGTDPSVQNLPAGLKGNLWFGWHRLAAHDAALRDLFLSIAFDLTQSGVSLPAKAQNKTMTEARLCFFAWGARLLAPNGQVHLFP